MRYETFLRSLQPDLNFHRTGKLFNTRNATYFYDAGTGKVFECMEHEYAIMNILLNSKNIVSDLEVLFRENTQYEQAFENITSLINEENILKLPVYDTFTNENYDADFLYHGKLKQITLEVTQKCNLRCKYCIYNEDFDQFRTFTQNDMTWDVAKAALDYANTYGADDLIVGFYGGEPLLNLPLIKKCISYCLNNLSNRSELIFTMTSNLTLLDEDSANYLASIPNMNIVCSLDGPREIQDRFRVFPNHLGSFDKTLDGLKLLVHTFKEDAISRISIHSVLCPPVNDEKLNAMKSFFESIPWLPRDIKKDVAYVSKDSLPEDYFKDNIDYSFHKDTSSKEPDDPLKKWTLHELCQKNYDNRYALQIEHGALMKSHMRFIGDAPMKDVFRNACCTPAIRKLYVTVDGVFSACERIGNAPVLGNVKDGLFYNDIQKKYLDEYDKYSLDKCNQCWALHMCSVCYAVCYDEHGLNKEKKEDACDVARITALHNLVEYYQLLEENEGVIDFIDSIYAAMT